MANRDGYYRDYFRKMGEKRRKYLRDRYAANPQSQRDASARYRAKPGMKEKIAARLKAYSQKPEVKAKRAALRKASSARGVLYALRRILRTRGVDMAWYERTGDAQEWRCAICRTDYPGASRFKRLHIDHCHKTNKVRGLLCNGCNRGLGYFGDNIAALLAAAHYVASHSVDIADVS